jgi:predicted aspartyl protease
VSIARRLPAAVLLSATVALGACGGSGDDGKNANGFEGAVTPNGKKVELQTEKAKPGQRRIRLQVVTTKGRNTLALVPVFINGRGPLAFAVDTGASQSLVDEDVAKKVGLKPGDDIGRLQGVAGSSRGRALKIHDWRAGGVALPADTIASLDGLNPDGESIDGLLGSDVLSRWGRVAIDYDNDVLLLDPKIKK